MSSWVCCVTRGRTGCGGRCCLVEEAIAGRDGRWKAWTDRQAFLTASKGSLRTVGRGWNKSEQNVVHDRRALARVSWRACGRVLALDERPEPWRSLPEGVSCPRRAGRAARGDSSGGPGGPAEGGGAEGCAGAGRPRCQRCSGGLGCPSVRCSSTRFRRSCRVSRPMQSSSGSPRLHARARRRDRLSCGQRARRCESPVACMGRDDPDGVAGALPLAGSRSTARFCPTRARREESEGRGHPARRTRCTAASATTRSQPDSIGSPRRSFRDYGMLMVRIPHEGSHSRPMRRARGLRHYRVHPRSVPAPRDSPSALRRAGTDPLFEVIWADRVHRGAPPRSGRSGTGAKWGFLWEAS